MNNNKQKFGLLHKIKFLMNSFNIGTGVITILFLLGLAGAATGVFISGTWLKSYTSFEIKPVLEYFEAISSLSGTININGTLSDAKTYAELLKPKILEDIETIIISGAIGFILTFVGIYFISKFVVNKFLGKKLEDQHLRGTSLLNEKELEKKQKKKEIDGYSITSKIKIDRTNETKHLSISGSSGAGKTVILRRLYLDQLNHPKNAAAKFIVHDVKGDWVSKFYNEKKDHIFNMSDTRGIKFNIFNFIENEEDLESVIATIIPKSKEEKDPIWTDSSRGILKGILIYCIATDNKTTKQVQKLLKLQSNQLLELLETVEGAESAVKFLSAGETQVANYMSNFESRTKYFTSIKECGNGEDFDLDAWLKDGKQSTIFMVNNPKYSDLYAVRISVFVESFVKLILSMKEDSDRRIYLYLDEMGSLAKMERVVDFLALARSYGGSAIIGIQEIARLDAIYGKELRQTIVNNCSSKIVLRAGDPDTAKTMSELIGEGETNQININSSVGVEQNRDGMSSASSIKKEFAVLPSEIMELDDLEFYFKQPSYKWGHIQSEFIPEFDLIEDKEEAFIPCKAGALFRKKDPKKDEDIKEEAIKTADDVLSTLKKKEGKKVIKIRANWGSDKPKKHKVEIEETEDFSKFNESNEIDIDDLDEEDLDNL